MKTEGEMPKSQERRVETNLEWKRDYVQYRSTGVVLQKYCQVPFVWAASTKRTNR